MRRALSLVLCAALAACAPGGADKVKKPRLCLFVGVDVSGSFQKGEYFDDAINFLAHYLHAHLNGLGGLEVPDTLFVGTIGGDKQEEAKTFFPKQTFDGKSAGEIAAKLKEIFPKRKKEAYTDFNAFFEQVALTVKNKNLVLRPIAVVMVSDGVPAFGKNLKKPDYKSIKLEPLENLSRNVSVRLVYTDAVTGKNWQTEVPRKRVKVWTQDAKVMVSWKEPHLLVPGKSWAEQDKLFAWIKDNVDFPVRSKRVD